MDVIVQSLQKGLRVDKPASVELEEVGGVWSRLKSLKFLDTGIGSATLPVVHHGYFDSHLHAVWGAFQESSLKFSNLMCLEDLKKLFANYDKFSNDKLNFAFSWNDSSLSPKLIRNFINSDFVKVPLVVLRSCGHAAIINNKAKFYFNESVYDSSGNVADKNIFEVYKEIKKITFTNSESLILSSIELMNNQGIIGYCDMSIDDNQAKIYKNLFENDMLNINVTTCAQVEYLDSIEPMRLKNKKTVLDQRHVKFFLDGSIGSKTAWITKPYLGCSSNDFGHQKYQDQELKELLLASLNKGFSFACHVIGDAALEQIIRVSEQIEGDLRNFYCKIKLPFRIEHLQIASIEQVQRIKKLGFFHLSLQPCHYIDDKLAAKSSLESSLKGCLHRLATFQNNDLDISLSSDFPIVPLVPKSNILAATQLLSKSEKISFYDCVWLMTRSAKQSLALNISDDNDSNNVKLGDLVCVSEPL